MILQVFLCLTMIAASDNSAQDSAVMLSPVKSITIAQKAHFSPYSHIQLPVKARVIDIGNHSSVKATLSADSIIAIGDSCLVEGEITFIGSLETGANCSISGRIRNGTLFPTQKTNSLTKIVKGENFSLSAGLRKNLEPKSYGDLHIGPSATVILSEGNYIVNSLYMENNAQILTNSETGNVVITVLNGCVFKSNCRVLSETSTGRIIVEGKAGMEVGPDCLVLMSLAVPNGLLSIQSGTTIGGNIEAKNANFATGVNFSYSIPHLVEEHFDQELLRADGSPDNNFHSADFYQAGFRFFNSAFKNGDKGSRWDEIKGQVALALDGRENPNLIPLVSVNDQFLAYQNGQAPKQRPFKMVATAIDTVFSPSVTFIAPEALALSHKEKVTKYSIRYQNKSWVLPLAGSVDAELDDCEGEKVLEIKAFYDNGKTVSNRCTVYAKKLLTGDWLTVRYDTDDNHTNTH
jgi:hypothetical protein